MTINGVVYIDLTEHVREQMLFFGDREAHTVYRHFDDAAGSYTLDIGDARTVGFCDPRVPELLSSAQQVTVVGSSPRGVAEAVEGLRGACRGAA